MMQDVDSDGLTAFMMMEPHEMMSMTLWMMSTPVMKTTTDVTIMSREKCQEIMTGRNWTHSA